MIRTAALPADALLMQHAGHAAYTDCFSIACDADLPRFINAFYATPLFRLERLILRIAGHPSTDADVTALALGADSYAAWAVTARTADQIMLTDRFGATATWLCARDGRVYLGSAVFRRGLFMRLTIGPHRIYSRLLLSAARRRLQASAT